MQRTTIVLDDELAKEIDRLTAIRGHRNRSETIRDLARSGIRRAAEEGGIEGQCVAILIYSYDYSERDLARRLAKTMHDNHNLSIASMQIYLDHNSKIEISAVCGAAEDVRRLGEGIIAERGVRHGRIVMLPAELGIESHAHAQKHSQRHRHIRIKEVG